MMEAEKKDISLNIAQKFVQLDQDSKCFIAGYMTGKLEERAKWEEKFNAGIKPKVNK